MHNKDLRNKDLHKRKHKHFIGFDLCVCVCVCVLRGDRAGTAKGPPRVQSNGFVLSLCNFFAIAMTSLS